MSENDRRVRRTRRALHVALIELMIERGYDRVTVQDILDRADVGRSTFYAHFRSKDDLLVVSGAEYLREAVAGQPDPVRALFDLAVGHGEVYRALLGRKSNAVVIRAARRMVAEVLDGDTATVTFTSWGLTGLLGAVAEGELTVTDAYRAYATAGKE